MPRGILMYADMRSKTSTYYKETKHFSVWEIGENMEQQFRPRTTVEEIFVVHVEEREPSIRSSSSNCLSGGGESKRTRIS